ncbi:MAG: lamin tail domain-containing protein [Myxococcales bacterium]|nr:lamin tail domain-containing protein [Myxococcales bacterium]
MSRCAPILLILAAGLALACSGATTGADAGDGDSGTSAEDTAGTGAASCGDGVRDEGEECDGVDLGTASCATIPGFVSGTLACTAACTFDVSACEGDPAAAIVRLNELTSEDIAEGPYVGGDAIELYNGGGAAADLAGWQISDDPEFADDKTYTFPTGSMLAPGGLLVLVQLDETTGTGDYPFGISGSNPETITLRDADGLVIDDVSFEGPDAAVSWCRLPDGDGPWQGCERTFGELNAQGEPPSCGDGMIGPGEDCDGADLGGVSDCVELDAALQGPVGCADDCSYDLGSCEGTPGMGVVLNELASSGNDEIELYNAGREAVDVSAWILTDDLSDPGDPYDPGADLEELVFAPGTVLQPGDFLVVVQGGGAGEHPFGLAATGDAVTLLTPGLVVVDFVAYGDGEAADSYCRAPDGPTGEWTAGCTPTFGDPNE